MNYAQSAAAAAFAVWLLATGIAHAQTAPAAASDQADMIEIYTDADASAVLNGRIAALKVTLELTPEQEKLWPAVEASIRKIGTDAISRGKARSQEQPANDFLDVLGRVAQAEAARASDLNAFVAAARPLVDALTDAQRNRMPALLGMTANPASPLATSSLWLFEEEER